MAVKTVQVIINGAVTTLSYNGQTGKYEATITAPSKSSYNVNAGHYYPVTVKATDEAGNVTTKTDADTTLGLIKTEGQREGCSYNHDLQSDRRLLPYHEQADHQMESYRCGFRRQSVNHRDHN